MLADDGERQFAQRGEQPVGHGFRIDARDDLAGLKRAKGVVGALGLGGHYLGCRRERSARDGCAAEQSAAAHGRQDNIQAARFLQQFHGASSLSGNDSRVVVRMNERRAGFRDNPLRRGFAVGERRLAIDHASPVSFDGGALHRRGVGRHDNRRGNFAQPRRERQRLSMIARGMSHHASPCFVFRQRKNGVARAAKFKSPHLLKVLALEEQLRAKQRVEI